MFNIELMKKLLLFFLLWKVVIIRAQDHGDYQLIRYDVRYNHLFDRGSDFKLYDAKLYVQGDRSLFTMKRTDQIESSLQSNYFDASPDSLFTVYKDFESNSLLFDFYHFQQGNVFYADTLHPMEWNRSEEQHV